MNRHNITVVPLVVCCLLATAPRSVFAIEKTDEMKTLTVEQAQAILAQPRLVLVSDRVGDRLVLSGHSPHSDESSVLTANLI